MPCVCQPAPFARPRFMLAAFYSPRAVTGGPPPPVNRGLMVGALFSFRRGLSPLHPVCWKCGIRGLRRGARLHPGSGTRERAGAPSALHVNLNSCLGPIGSRTTWTGSHTMPQTIIGCDISRDWLDLHALPEGKACRVANTRDDIAVWLAQLGPDPLVIFEATSG